MLKHFNNHLQGREGGWPACFPLSEARGEREREREAELVTLRERTDLPGNPGPGLRLDCLAWELQGPDEAPLDEGFL